MNAISQNQTSHFFCKTFLHDYGYISIFNLHPLLQLSNSQQNTMIHEQNTPYPFYQIHA